MKETQVTCFKKLKKSRFLRLFYYMLLIIKILLCREILMIDIERYTAGPCPKRALPYHPNEPSHHSNEYEVQLSCQNERQSR